MVRLRNNLQDTSSLAGYSQNNASQCGSGSGHYRDCNLGNDQTIYGIQVAFENFFHALHGRRIKGSSTLSLDVHFDDSAFLNLSSRNRDCVVREAYSAGQGINLLAMNLQRLHRKQ